jgi:hypothetical protein
VHKACQRQLPCSMPRPAGYSVWLGVQTLEGATSLLRGTASMALVNACGVGSMGRQGVWLGVQTHESGMHTCMVKAGKQEVQEGRVCTTCTSLKHGWTEC